MTPAPVLIVPAAAVKRAVHVAALLTGESVSHLMAGRPTRARAYAVEALLTVYAGADPLAVLTACGGAFLPDAGAASVAAFMNSDGWRPHVAAAVVCAIGAAIAADLPALPPPCSSLSEENDHDAALPAPGRGQSHPAGGGGDADRQHAGGQGDPDHLGAAWPSGVGDRAVPPARRGGGAELGAAGGAAGVPGAGWRWAGRPGLSHAAAAARQPARAGA